MSQIRVQWELICFVIKFQKASRENSGGRPGFSNSEVGGLDSFDVEPVDLEFKLVI